MWMTSYPVQTGMTVGPDSALHLKERHLTLVGVEKHDFLVTRDD
jgi:hypothetical protein